MVSTHRIYKPSKGAVFERNGKDSDHSTDLMSTWSKSSARYQEIHGWQVLRITQSIRAQIIQGSENLGCDFHLSDQASLPSNLTRV